jgi:hypothetical protein
MGVDSTTFFEFKAHELFPYILEASLITCGGEEEKPYRLAHRTVEKGSQGQMSSCVTIEGLRAHSLKIIHMPRTVHIEATIPRQPNFFPHRGQKERRIRNSKND